MFRFENPEYLWLLLVIPFLLLLRLWGWRRNKKRFRSFGDPALVRRLVPDASSWRPQVKFGLLLLAVALMVVALARPQAGSKVSHEKRNGIETIICMDISNSMLSQDVEPSRLEKSKMLVENLVDNFTNDKIGLVVFAGESYVQLPITSDYVSAKMFLQNISPSLIQSQGTDIAGAINLAMRSFTQDTHSGKAVIVITDGEDHEGGAVEAAKAAHEKGANVFILGIGQSKGSPIPLGDGSYMRDRQGNVVMTRLNEDMCRQVAQAGQGRYIHVDNTSDAQQQLNDGLAKLQKGETDSVIYSAYDEQFQAFLLIVIALLIIEALMSETDNKLFARFHIFRRLPVVLLALAGMFFAPSSAFAQNDRSLIRSGNREFRHRQFKKADVDYRKAMAKNNNNAQAVYNLGCALLMQQKDSLALKAFQQSGRMETNHLRASRSWHNAGFILQNHRQYAAAIDAYKQALRLNPSDDKTRYNLALCKKLLKNQPQNNQNKNKQNKKKNKKQQQNQQQNKNNNNKNDKDKQQRQQQKMSRENAEQLLQAAEQQEQSTKQRISKSMSAPSRRQFEQNW